jgi:hypothetical protein
MSKVTGRTRGDRQLVRLADEGQRGGELTGQIPARDEVGDV